MHEPEKVLLTSLRLGYKYPRHYYLYWKFLLFLQNKRQISKISTYLSTVCFILLVLLKSTYASFETNSSGNALSKVAFYILNTKTETENLKISNIKPDGKDNNYLITVSNFNDTKVSDVDLEYSLEIRTTTNIPVTYKLYLNDSSDNIMSTKELVKDTDNTYFYKYNSILQNFTHQAKKTDTYKLVINFPSDYNDEVYQSMIDDVEITVNARQKND